MVFFEQPSNNRQLKLKIARSFAAPVMAGGTDRPSKLTSQDQPTLYTQPSPLALLGKTAIKD
jgi:hypothetical protein